MRVRVRYPLRSGRMLLRTDADWQRDLEPRRSSNHTFDFELGSERPFRYFKPILEDERGASWSQGENYLALQGTGPREVYPHFDPDSSCHVCTLHAVPSSFTDRVHDVRVWLPPGYDENELARYPVLYMQDGQNLFFPEQAFGGQHWRVSETLGVLHSMNLIRPAIVVGVVPRDRMIDYTNQGYGAYARFLARELKPWVDAHYRTLSGPRDTAVLGSSLGGVVSLHVAWEHADVFGQVGCMSSTFGYADDLLERVERGPRRPLRIYLDTGWPADNYEVTRSMRTALLGCGYREGSDLRYLAFPEERHNEQAWARRAHLPFQFFFEELPQLARARSGNGRAARPIQVVR